MNSELNAIVSKHLTVNLPKALRGQKFIKNTLKFTAPIVAVLVFILVLWVGFTYFASSVQSVLWVVLAALLLPLWAIMPLAQLFTSKTFVQLDNNAAKRLRIHIEHLSPYMDPDMAAKLSQLLRENMVPTQWWEDLETRTKGLSARLFVQSLPKT